MSKSTAPRFAVGDRVMMRNGRKFTVTSTPADYRGTGADAYRLTSDSGRVIDRLERDLALAP